MKSIIKISILLYLFCHTSVKAGETKQLKISENNPPTLIEGTWEWRNGDRVFRVFIYRSDAGGMEGNFEMVKIVNGIETKIYKSDKPIFDLEGTRYPPAISGGGNDEGFTGRILDNSIEYDPSEKEMVRAWLEMKIFVNNGVTTSTWKVKHYDLTPSNAAPINIPNNITLTKVSL